MPQTTTAPRAAGSRSDCVSRQEKQRNDSSIRPSLQRIIFVGNPADLAQAASRLDNLAGNYRPFAAMAATLRNRAALLGTVTV